MGTYEKISISIRSFIVSSMYRSEGKNELEKVLKEFFIRALLKKRADENNDGKKKKRNSKID